MRTIHLLVFLFLISCSEPLKKVEPRFNIGDKVTLISNTNLPFKRVLKIVNCPLDNPRHNHKHYCDYVLDGKISLTVNGKYLIRAGK